MRKSKCNNQFCLQGWNFLRCSFKTYSATIVSCSRNVAASDWSFKYLVFNGVSSNSVVVWCCFHRLSLCWFEGLFSFFLELHQIQVHVVIQYMNPFTIVLLCRVNCICNILLVNVMFHSTRKKHICTHQAFGVARRVANKYRSEWCKT